MHHFSNICPFQKQRPVINEDKRRQHFVCYIDFPEELCSSHLIHLTNHSPGSLIIMSCYIGLFETCETSNNFESCGWFGQPHNRVKYHHLLPDLIVPELTVLSFRQMTTACEEKSTATFTREVGDQSSVSIRVLDQCLGLTYYSNVVWVEFFVYSLTC